LDSFKALNVELKVSLVDLKCYYCPISPCFDFVRF
jgi:hypothetical protein